MDDTPADESAVAPTDESADALTDESPDAPTDESAAATAPASEFPVRGEAPDPVRIRRFEPGDGPALVALHERALADAGTDPADVPGTADLRWVERAYLEPGGEFLVADAPAGEGGENSEVVAMGGVVVDGAVGELYRFAVDPDAQRDGLGSALLDALERAARDRGVERLVLTTARRQAAAVSFYAARGYAETDRESHGEYELVDFAKSLE